LLNRFSCGLRGSLKSFGSNSQKQSSLASGFRMFPSLSVDPAP
jgi:hypothetical protein